MSIGTVGGGAAELPGILGWLKGAGIFGNPGGGADGELGLTILLVAAATTYRLRYTLILCIISISGARVHEIL